MSERLRIGDNAVQVGARAGQDGAWHVTIDAAEHCAEQVELRDGELRFTVAGRSYRMLVHVMPDAVLVDDGVAAQRLARVEEGAPDGAAAAKGELQSQMPGKVLALLVEPGAQVQQGQAVLILEAMKMEHELCAPAAGVVRGFPRQPGERVMPGDLLVDFEPS